MNHQRFEDLEIWKKSKFLAVNVYKTFGSLKDYEFRNQLTACAISISNNIAEGFERISQRDYRHFLIIAKGSAGEFRSMLYLALDLGYISHQTFQKYLQLAEEISRMLAGYVKALSK